MVEPDSTELGAVVDNRQIVSFPLDGRNFLRLSLLLPGTAPSAQGSPGSVRGEFSVNVSGARADSNNFILDGAFNNDPKLNTFAINPPVDAIREFKILTGTYDASFGRRGGAQINVALKSGTNQLHGTAYEFFRNGSLDAQNFFARAEDGKPRYQRNQYGFSLGGPVRKDLTFFFTDYEGRRAREGVTRATNVPTELERGGDFSESLLARPVDPYTQQPFSLGPNSIRSNHRILERQSQIYIRFRTARCRAELRFLSDPKDRDDRFDVRIDHNLSKMIEPGCPV